MVGVQIHNNNYIVTDKQITFPKLTFKAGVHFLLKVLMLHCCSWIISLKGRYGRALNEALKKTYALSDEIFHSSLVRFIQEIRSKVNVYDV